MNQPNRQKKESNVSKENKVQTSDKEKTKSSNSVSKDSQFEKNKINNKSTSQTSISHFSSVSNPEYREGWNRIFGEGNKKTELKSQKRNQGLDLQELSIPDEDIDPEIRITFRKAFKQHALKQGFDIKEVEDLMDGPNLLEYRVKKIK